MMNNKNESVQIKQTTNWGIIYQIKRAKQIEWEIWADIKGYEGYYQVSSQGRVRSLDRVVTVGEGAGQYKRKYKAQIKKQRYDKDGYKRVSLSLDGKLVTYQVHRLVAVAFLINLDEKLEVNHMDRNKENNAISNLEWCTRQENMKHYSKTNSLKGIK